MVRRSHALAAKNSTKKLSMLRVQSCCRHSQFRRLKAQVTQSEFVTVKPGFHMIATIAAIAEKNKFSDRSDNNRWDRTLSILAIVVAAIRATIAGEWFPYDHCDHPDRWTFLLSDRSDHMETRLKRQKYLYYTYRRSFFGSKNACDPYQSWVLRKWNSSHDKCVDPSWFSKATTTTMINKCKCTKRLPGCYAEFITFAILLRKRFNQGLFIRILKKEKKKNSRQSWGLPYCQ